MTDIIIGLLAFIGLVDVLAWLSRILFPEWARYVDEKLNRKDR